MLKNNLRLGISKEDFNSFLQSYINKESVPIEQQKLLWHALKTEDKDILNDRLNYLKKIEACLMKNVEYFEKIFKLSEKNCDDIKPIKTNFTCILSLIVREWSTECTDELNEWYNPILQTIDQSNINDQLRSIHLGADLLKLSYYLAERGIKVDAVTDCVMKYHVILSILKNEKNEIYPFATNFDNVIDSDNQIRRICFPETKFLQNSLDLINIQYGDENFKFNESTYDFVLTTGYFHIDSDVYQTAKNIYHCLKSNGIWINNSPLSHSFKKTYRLQTSYSGFSYKELLEIIKDNGFKIEECNLKNKSTFCKDHNKMLFEKFSLMFFIARKVTN